MKKTVVLFLALGVTLFGLAPAQKKEAKPVTITGRWWTTYAASNRA